MDHFINHWNNVEKPLFQKHWKLILLCLFTEYVHCVCTNYRYSLYKPDEPLQDVLHDVLPVYPEEYFWVMDIVLFVEVALALLWITTPLFRRNSQFAFALAFKHGSVVMAQGILLRILSYMVTSLPAPTPHCLPGAEEFHPPRTVYEIFFSSNTDTCCGDLVFSGHCFHTFMLTLLVHKFGAKDRVHNIVRGIMWFLFPFQLFFLLVLRQHYTLDLVVAIYVTVMLFYLYDYLEKIKIYAKAYGSLPDICVLQGTPLQQSSRSVDVCRKQIKHKLSDSEAVAFELLAQDSDECENLGVPYAPQAAASFVEFEALTDAGAKGKKSSTKKKKKAQSNAFLSNPAPYKEVKYNEMLAAHMTRGD
eukprot:GCRY01000536.1.p1 GENE.GCRY01000536.1~~GCRY01000536.1.p1  ORF type:complete len:361 (-),score=81.42 GCRY01000536.1:641-1723(-)